MLSLRWIKQPKTFDSKKAKILVKVDYKTKTLVAKLKTAMSLEQLDGKPLVKVWTVSHLSS